MTDYKMPDNHIIRLLEEKPLTGLSPDEIAGIELHAAECSECRHEYDAACVAALLIRERVAEATEVSPFFKTRVMATIRERQLSSDGPALLKMWRAARALVSVMATLVVILTALTIFNQSGEEPLALAVAEGASIYSPEYVLLGEGDIDGDGLMYDQVLATIYDGGDADEQ
jgi:predicted anti-sigma-YlaC factor YlaD